jgi:hypothetical protein
MVLSSLLPGSSLSTAGTSMHTGHGYKLLHRVHPFMWVLQLLRLNAYQLFINFCCHRAWLARLCKLMLLPCTMARICKQPWHGWTPCSACMGLWRRKLSCHSWARTPGNTNAAVRNERMKTSANAVVSTRFLCTPLGLTRRRSHNLSKRQKCCGRTLDQSSQH